MSAERLTAEQLEGYTFKDGGLSGYHAAEVDAFMEHVVAALREHERAARGEVAWAVVKRLDVEEATFRKAMMSKSYAVDDVDGVLRRVGKTMDVLRQESVDNGTWLSGQPETVEQSERAADDYVSFEAALPPDPAGVDPAATGVGAGAAGAASAAEHSGEDEAPGTVLRTAEELHALPAGAVVVDVEEKAWTRGAPQRMSQDDPNEYEWFCLVDRPRTAQAMGETMPALLVFKPSKPITL